MFRIPSLSSSNSLRPSSPPSPPPPPPPPPSWKGMDGCHIQGHGHMGHDLMWACHHARRPSTEYARQNGWTYVPTRVAGSSRMRRKREPPLTDHRPPWLPLLHLSRTVRIPSGDLARPEDPAGDNTGRFSVHGPRTGKVHHHPPTPFVHSGKKVPSTTHRSFPEKVRTYMPYIPEASER